jgi:hypothetical protein
MLIKQFIKFVRDGTSIDGRVIVENPLVRILLLIITAPFLLIYLALFFLVLYPIYMLLAIMGLTFHIKRTGYIRDHYLEIIDKIRSRKIAWADIREVVHNRLTLRDCYTINYTDSGKEKRIVIDNIDKSEDFMSMLNKHGIPYRITKT